ncbi:hypothetical protein H0H93_002193 [Arthromyces matolae]|nr:hypothetical protein H0H93_002193 [Arthromyces matolae]
MSWPIDDQRTTTKLNGPQMSKATPVTLNDVFPELFPVIFTHVPLPNRVPTLLSLALTSHHLHNVIIPHVLYNDVRLVGEDQALPVLKRFLEAVKDASRNNNEGTIIPTQCVHHLCIDSMQIGVPDTSLTQLQNLIDIDALTNLVSLTLHIEGDDSAPLPKTFWSSLKEHCPNLKGIHLTGIPPDDNTEWIQSEIFTIQGLSSIRLEGVLQETVFGLEMPTLNFDFSTIPPSLHTLELRMSDTQGFYSLDAASLGGLLSMVLPNLCVLILDHIDVGKPNMTNKFWRAHSRLERLELWRKVTGTWFQDFEFGLLPNLKAFKSDFISARNILPYVAQSLVSLCLLDTYNAQASYLLRTVAPGGTLPALRSLGIHRRQSGNSPKPFEGHRWREDANGVVTEVPLKNAARRFDGNYLMSVARAAPDLEELELMGDSDDTIDSITASLCRMRKLNRLTLSGPINGNNAPFFKSSCNWTEYADWDLTVSEDLFGRYGPSSSDQAMHDLADGCRTLETITFGNMIGDLLIKDGVSARIVRDTEGGSVKEVRKIRAWGNIIGREEEW